MFHAICTVDDCDRHIHARGLCNKHYQQWRRHGLLATSLLYGVPDAERIARRIIKQDGECWEWQGYLTFGYGRFIAQDGHMKQAHRVSYELAKGPIPEGLTIDHLCFNPRCVNPDHLEAVTLTENNRRAFTRRFEMATTCKAGLHPYPENRVPVPSNGRTTCRLCAKAARRRWRVKQATRS